MPTPQSTGLKRHTYCRGEAATKRKAQKAQNQSQENGHQLFSNVPSSLLQHKQISRAGPFPCSSVMPP
jgi:hypothetical protein